MCLSSSSSGRKSDKFLPKQDTNDSPAPPFRVQQFEAMKWLKDEVSINYRCLLLYTLVGLKNSRESRITNGSDSVNIY